MASKEAELLFSGQLLAVTANETSAAHVQIKKEAMSFLQRLAEPVLVVSFHGAKHSGKTSCIHSLLGITEQDALETEGVWLYVKRVNFPNAKYLAIMDRPGFGDTQLDVLLYSILAGLSSVVVHHVDGQLTSEAVDQFEFLAANEEGSDTPPSYVPLRESDAFDKRVEKLVRLFMDSVHNQYMKGVVLNGPLIGSIVISMLAHRDNVFKAFRGRIWKDTIHNCCLNIVENGIKLYKLRMSERLGSIVDVSDLKGFKPTLSAAQGRQELIELPCETEILREVHDIAKHEAKANLRTMPKAELAKFMHEVIRPQLAEFSEKLERIRQHDVDVVEEAIQKKEEKCEEFNAKHNMYQKETMTAQEEVKRQLVEVAKLHTVQLPEQKVIEAAQDKEITELQGYLIKQGGGGKMLNPLGRKNWKQRYFILIGANLIYAKTKDDYERGKIIKELCLTGCRIDPSRDAGEGFNIVPGKQAHVFELQKGFFEKNSKKRSSAADSGRTFKLRAQNIQERDVWIDKLRQAAGGY
ncbi:hypothetical protein BBO99_00000023 [Phytophthora kernoviae]|uniref:PH domain-containing protein n=2 Tax=Phytophthora kernoviae TaxID=325452 RepID=A0A421H3D4_9STRA|nr:hypothetical protein G195_003401 [Phytophthora kernoviae 00238/432]KAG2533132.1 hypothetical protein JM16_000211 [Phytophthora kernoviae]KAG2533338.1 hypothetical protein JM18_000142 [Phytophthora kernoviae]RLN26919.1 hypothetical protein BBI17_000023 [Phytophthora kernoviae]RLN85966.1 hypothetical protein BBO99_00000023 [Phytophthora kernoviae]